jgi:DNA polymerase I-like protein with 3'-5' exonuclease and polymerase domains
MSEPFKIISFDTETEKISYLNPVPDLICMTYSEAGALKGSIKTPWQSEIDAQVKLWWDKGTHTVGHNIAFDLSILAFRYPELLPEIFAALDASLIHDTMLREKLLNITRHGNLEMLEVNGAVKRINYALTDLEQKYLNIDRSDLKDAEDAPRMNYAIYKNVPVAEWDEKFLSYAIDDAVNTGLIYQCQEEERKKCIDNLGIDPFKTEAFRCRSAFALRLMECTGSLLDGQKVEEVAKEFITEYNKPSLCEPLLAAGLLIPGVPPRPYANGALDHCISCVSHPDHPEFKKGKKVKDCGCPPRMKEAEPEHSPTKPLFKYIWKASRLNPEIKLWPSDGQESKLKQDGLYERVILEGAFRREVVMSLEEIPDDITLKTDNEWTANFAALDPLLSLWQDRKTLRKIVTDYLPKLYYTDPTTGVQTPATIIRAGYDALKLTGRCSSFASSLYPSRNDQNVDPRVRPCTIPRPGNVLCSTDYAGMELATLAEKCVQLFGYSELANKINAGIDTHAYLAAQIAYNMDDEFSATCRLVVSGDDPQSIYDVFKNTKGLDESCEAELPNFAKVYKHEHRDDNPPLDHPVYWSNFYKHYRTMAKPTGLGYPGGLGAATFISYAKATFGLKLDLETAQKLKSLWLSTYPEMGQYLDYVGKQCKDPHHFNEEYVDDDGKPKQRVFYAYDTPRGLHRAKCSFCEAANGQALQAFAADGALDGLYEVTKAVWLASYQGYENPLLDTCYILAFIHDEILWECPNDDLIGERAKAIQKLMIDAMQIITPHVKAGAETAVMQRWYKTAEAVWVDGKLRPWEPKKKDPLATQILNRDKERWWYHPESCCTLKIKDSELEADPTAAQELMELGDVITGTEYEGKQLLEYASRL